MNIIEKAVDKLEKELEAELASKPADNFNADDNDDDFESDVTLVNPVQSEPAKPKTAPEPTPKKVTQEYEKSEANVRSRYIELDLHQLSNRGLLTPEKAQTLTSEELRIVKRPLLRRAAVGTPDYVENGNLIILTSSLPGEGKTFNSINLAMSIAMEVDRTVLLVDADVMKSDVSRTFGVENEPGLSDYLIGEERDLSKLLLKTNVENLTLMPSGPHYSKLTEMLASQQMRTLVDELACRYADRIILFDSPPLLATSGASVLTSLMGQILMVVEAVRTPQSAVREALRHIIDLSKVSILFNKQRSQRGSGYGYGYGSGYGYGYGYGYGKNAKDK